MSTKLVFVETIANPGTQIADLAGIGEVCREASVLFVVDNTIATPCLFKPKDVGAGLIFHSLSKYICGHGNALGGVVIDTGFFDWRECESIYDIYKKDFPEDEMSGSARKFELKVCVILAVHWLQSPRITFRLGLKH